MNFRRGGLIAGAILCLLSVLLYGLAFPPFDLAEAAYVFAIPLLVWSAFVPRFKRDWAMYIGGGWLAWLVLISWLRHFSEHLEMPLPWLPGWAAWFALSLVMGSIWGLWFIVSTRLFRASIRRPVWVRILTVLGLPAFWVVLEWIRSWLFTGFPWLPLSVSQWERPLIFQVASWTGGYGVSFILMAFNVGLAHYLVIIWTRRGEKWHRRLSWEFYTALACLFSAIGLGLSTLGNLQNREPLPKAGLVQPSVSAMEKWTSESFNELLASLGSLSEYSAYLDADFIVWPESPTPLPVMGNDRMQEWVENLSKRLELPLLIGNIAVVNDGDEEKWYNGVFLISPDQGLSEKFYSKRHLVPFGEYMPLGKLLSFLETVIPLPGQFYPGTEPTPLAMEINGKKWRVGNLVCYEDTYPSLGRETALSGVDFFYVASNNAWFGEGAGAYQHAAHSVLRAVETRRPVLRCGNSGWSGWIDEFGHIRHVMLDENENIYFRGSETISLSRSRYWANRASFYVKHGDWIVWLSCALIVILAGAIKYSRDETPPEDRVGIGFEKQAGLNPRFSVSRKSK